MVAINENLRPKRTDEECDGDIGMGNLYRRRNPRNRSRSSAMSRCLTRDPLRYIKGANTHQFVGSDPVGKVYPREEAWHQSGWWGLIPAIGPGFTIGNAVASYEEAGYDAASAPAAQGDWMQRAANPNSRPWQVPTQDFCREEWQAYGQAEKASCKAAHLPGTTIRGPLPVPDVVPASNAAKAAAYGINHVAKALDN